MRAESQFLIGNRFNIVKFHSTLWQSVVFLNGNELFWIEARRVKRICMQQA